MKVFMLKDNDRWIGAFSSLELAQDCARKIVSQYTDDESGLHGWQERTFWVAVAHGMPCKYPIFIYEWDVDRLAGLSRPTYEVPVVHVMLTEDYIDTP